MRMCLLGNSRGSKPEVGESAEPQGKLAKHAAGVLMKILYAAQIARFDLLGTVNRLARRITKWTEEDDAALFTADLLAATRRPVLGKKVFCVQKKMFSVHFAITEPSQDFVLRKIVLWTKQIVLCTKKCAVYKMKETWAGRCPPRDQQREKKTKKTEKEMERVNKTSGFHFGVSYFECSPWKLRVRESL